MSNRILILGAGMVSGPLVAYLSQKGYPIRLASHLLAEAERLAHDKPGVEPIALDVTDDEALDAAIAQADVTVSFVPFVFHDRIAESCLRHHSHFVSASYESPAIVALHDQAREKELLFLSETGFDPGIDHMSAMRIIDEEREAGNTIEAFVSWGAGLPHIQDAGNPFGYKFSWAPKGVLMALKNRARYRKDGRLIELSPDDLTQTKFPAWTDDGVVYEGYPNRDSLAYERVYGLESARTILRGTLRYPGFLDAMHEAKKKGYLDDTPKQLPGNWQALSSQLAAERPEAFTAESHEALRWLGVEEKHRSLAPSTSVMDAFCHLLQERLVYENDEQDMALLIHKFVIRRPDGSKRLRMSTVKVFGKARRQSAMSKCVGLPAAIATDLLLQGKIATRGARIPVTKDFYGQILPALEQLGIACQESDVHIDEQEFLRELQ
jgi:saccharopine dehydrogenase-like NADP-dependent oxidoreductase